MTPRVIQVLTITASPKVRHRVTQATMFSRRIQMVGIVDSSEEALEFIDSGAAQPEVILLDVAVPGLDGVATIRTILADLFDTEIIALISFLEGITGEEAIRAGAIGHLPRNSLSDPMVVRAIILAHNGLKFRVPALIAPEAPTEMRRWPPTSGQGLTEQEQEVLRLLVHGLSSQKIADRMVITPSTVRSHMRSIRSKLGTKTRTDTVAYARLHDLLP